MRQKQTEQSVREVNEQLRTFIEYSPAALAMFDRNMCYLHASRQWREDFKLVGQILLGRSHYALFPKTSQRWKDVPRRALTGETVRVDEDRFERADGSVHWLRWEARPWRDPAGEVGGVIIHAEDITDRKGIGSALAQRTALLDTLHTMAPVGLGFVDTSFRVVRFNETMASFGHATPEACVGRPIAEIVPELWPALAPLYKRALAGHSVVDREIFGELTATPGELRHWRVSYYPVRVEKEIIGVGIVAAEITEAKRNEYALRKSEERYRAMFETMLEGFCVIEVIFDAAQNAIDYRFLEINPAFENQTGLQNARGRLMRELVPDHEEHWFEVYGKVALTGEPVRFENEAKALGRYYEVSAYRVGVPERHKVAVIFNDITQRKQMEISLRESEERFRQLVQGLPAAVYTCDVKGRILLYNAEAVKLWGQEPDCKRKRWCGSHRIFDERGNPLRRRDLAIVRAIREGKTSQEPERIIERPDGSRAYVLAYPDLIRDSTGLVTGAVSMLFDITALKETENALRATERKLKTLSRAVEQSPASVVITDPSGEIEYVNPTFAEVTGYTMEEVIGKNPRFLKSGRHRPEFYRQMWETIAAGQDWRGVICNRKKNGEEIWEFAVIAPIHDAKEKITHFVAIKEDITLRRQALEALHDREERLRAILDTVMDAVITIDQQRRIVGVNRATRRMFGYSDSELLNQNVSILLPSPYQEEEEQPLSEQHPRIGPESIIDCSHDVQARRKDGSVFPVELAVSEVRHLRLFTCVIRDVTLRRQLEAEVLQISEDERQRVAADLHDGICQELMGLSYLATAVQRDLQEPNPKLAAKVKSLSEAISQAATHTREVARGMTPVVADKDGLMLALRQLAANTAQAHCVRCLFKCSTPVIINDIVAANQLYRVAQEAIQNAIQHGKPTQITIALREDDGGICLAIKDNGRGLSEHESVSNGIGLRTMQYRASLLGGHLSLNPRRGGGTEVLCRLPKIPLPPQ
jgi:PAS domain S-box-containing protein